MQSHATERTDTMSAATRSAPPEAPFDIEKVRADFPILSKEMRGKPLAFLDSGASSQHPRAVIQAVSELYENYYANIHRGVYELSQKSTEAYEAARAKVARFLNAPSDRECVFTSGTTASVNLVAQSWGRANLAEGDVVLVTEMEHHSNLVPWQLIAAERGATVKAVPVLDDGALDMEAFARLVKDDVKLVAVAHVSNVLGTVNPIEEICRQAHEAGSLVLVDGAQAVPHMAVDVQALGCDFYAFSGHKMFGPSGIGVLWGHKQLLDAMPPWMGGGGMISLVSISESTYLDSPERFEAGTPNIAGAIGLGAAIDYLQDLGMDQVAAWEGELLCYGTGRLQELDGVRILGTAPQKASVLSFVVDGMHPHDVGTILDQKGVAIRAGHHCAQPLMERLGVPATARASLAAYNTHEDLDRLVDAIRTAQELFA